jgi:hypothetical protein
MRKLIALAVLGAALVLAAVAFAAETYKVSASLRPGADVPKP